MQSLMNAMGGVLSRHPQKEMWMVGDPVKISGVASRPELNGLSGWLQDYFSERERWAVEVCIGDKVEVVAAGLQSLERSSR